VIGAADFSESEVLANLYALLAQKAGYTTEIKTVTTREIYEPALEAGQIDIVPDYAATFTEYLNDKKNGANAPVVATTDKDTTLVQLNKLAAPLGLKALEPSDAADENAFAVTTTFAKAHNLTTLSDLGKSGLSIKLAAPAECKTRTFCGLALTNQYGIKISQYDPFDFDSVPGKQAVKTGKDDVVEVATDDGALSDFNLVILQDDKHVRQEVRQRRDAGRRDQQVGPDPDQRRSRHARQRGGRRQGTAGHGREDLSHQQGPALTVPNLDVIMRAWVTNLQVGDPVVQDHRSGARWHRSRSDCPAGI
jgi:glycine betaine/choline ABC-type transport system substrate-binding protein